MQIRRSHDALGKDSFFRGKLARLKSQGGRGGGGGGAGAGEEGGGRGGSVVGARARRHMEKDKSS